MRQIDINEKGKFALIRIIGIVFLVLVLSLIANAVEDAGVQEDVFEATEYTGESAVLDDNELIEEELLGNLEEPEKDFDEVANNSEEINDLCFEVDCEISEIICPDGFVISCENVCDSEDGVCDNCVPDCTEHELEIILNKTNQTTELENITNLVPELNLEVFSSDSILRGEILEVKALIKVNEVRVNNVSLEWIFSENFKIVSGNIIEECGDLDVGEFCELIINLEVLDLAQLGKNEIKVGVSYEE